jgi:hypothetical protein
LLLGSTFFIRQTGTPLFATFTNPRGHMGP